MRFARASAVALLAALAVAGCSGGGSSGGFYGPQASTATTTPGSTATTPTPQLAPPPTYGTRHCWPIVLVHGFSGFKQLGPLEYWYHIPEALRAQGFEVFVVQDSPYNTIATRAQEMQNQVLAQYPDPRVKVNLIGHSMGGLDSRYAVSQLALGGKAASVTTIGTPHHGSSVADVILGLIPGVTQSLLNLPFQVIGMDLSGGGNDLTTVYLDQTFNPNTPDVPGVGYFSWAGVADPLGQSGCVLEPALLSGWSILANLEGPNDGLVSVTSAQWGSFQGVVAADHLNEVGQLAGATTFDYVTFYENWAAQLEALGYGP